MLYYHNLMLFLSPFPPSFKSFLLRPRKSPLCVCLMNVDCLFIVKQAGFTQKKRATEGKIVENDVRKEIKEVKKQLVIERLRVANACRLPRKRFSMRLDSTHHNRLSIMNIHNKFNLLFFSSPLHGAVCLCGHTLSEPAHTSLSRLPFRETCENKKDMAHESEMERERKACYVMITDLFSLFSCSYASSTQLHINDLILFNLY